MVRVRRQGREMRTFETLELACLGDGRMIDRVGGVGGCMAFSTQLYFDTKAWIERGVVQELEVMQLYLIDMKVSHNNLYQMNMYTQDIHLETFE